MIGCISAFSEIDLNIHGTVRFRNGLVVQIEGFGTAFFSCKNNEHRAPSLVCTSSPS
jgi:hypothetical protein